MVNVKYLVFGQVVLFILFLSLLSTDVLYGIDRIAATFLVGMLLAYGITEKWKPSIITGIVFVFVVGLIDGRGPFSDFQRAHMAYDQSPSSLAFAENVQGNLLHKYNQLYQPHDQVHFSGQKFLERFGDKVEAAGDDTDGASAVASTETDDTDNLGLAQPEDLEKLLKKDERNDSNYKSKSEGGLAQLDKLLSLAKGESPYEQDERDRLRKEMQKDVSTYTPAQAQRATYQLIDTVKQLKTTLEHMAPTLKAGKGIMDMFKEMDIDPGK